MCTTKNTGVALSDKMGFVWCKHVYVQPRTGVALSDKMGFAKRFLFSLPGKIGKTEIFKFAMLGNFIIMVDSRVIWENSGMPNGG